MTGSPTATFSLRRRLARASLAVGSLLTALLVLGAVTVALMVSTQRDVTGRLYAAVSSAAGLFEAVLDQETGLRGYQLSGDPAFLEPYESGAVAQRESYERLRALQDDDRELAAALERVQAAIETWRREIAEPRIERVRVQGRALLAPQELAVSKVRFDDIRAADAAYRGLLDDRRAQAAGRLRAATGLLVGVAALSAVAVVAAGLALWRALRRWVTAPLTDLAAEVREVRSGQLDRPVVVGGPQEITSVASDVDAMRQRIVAGYTAAVTARGEAEAAQRRIEEQARELRRSNEELEQFAYVASHDLQEPLRKVASFCQMLERRYKGQLDERADQYIGFAVDGAKRMQVLINDLLAFSRVGRVTTGFTLVDLDECLDRVLQVLEPTAQEAGAVVTADPLPTVRGEQSLLTQLLQNLLGNALKFRGPQPPRIHVGVERRGAEWEFAVSDNGIGIEPQFADKIFVIFQRLHARDDYAGTGIGLALCKKIVEHHGGRIWLDTSRTGGTTFRWTLPVPVGAEAAA